MLRGMKARSALSFLVLFIVCLGGVKAKWMFIDTEAVPVARVLANLEERLKRDTNDVAVL
jgi:hypothetical protein